MAKITFIGAGSTVFARNLLGDILGHEELAGSEIALFDIVFSIDSVVTAVGLSEHLPIMIAAVVLAMLVMLVASGPVGDFVERHPTVKMLALSFLLLIGTALVADAAHFHIPRGYLYFAVAFSGMVEGLNQFVSHRRGRKKKEREAKYPDGVPPLF